MAEMSARERFLSIARFESPDRPFYALGGPRSSTLLTWRKQGLPEWIENSDDFTRFVEADPMEYLVVDMGARPPWERREEAYGETKILDITPLTDDPHGPAWKGIRFKPSERPTPGFETRAWIEFPVTDRSTFEQVAERFDGSDPARYEPG